MTAAGQVIHAFPAYKVFIFGQDVTNDVLDVRVIHHVGRTPCACKITLANELDKYICTSDDLNLLYNDPTIKQAVLDLKALYKSDLVGANDFKSGQKTIQQEIDQQITRNLTKITPAIKRKILGIKLSKRQTDVQADDVNGEPSSNPLLVGDALRYPITAESPIFHSNDPIRVFYRDPFDPTRWYHMFAGLMTDWDDTVSENNESIITITGEGPLKLLRLARVSFNPGVIKSAASKELESANRSFYTDGFYQYTLPEIVFISLFGNDPTGEVGKFSIDRTAADGKTTTSSLRLQGVGSFNFSRSVVLEYGPPSADSVPDPLKYTGLQVPTDSVDSLAKYQSLIDHEVKESDLIEMLAEGINSTQVSQFQQNIKQLPKLADGSVDPVNIIQTIGTQPESYPVDGGRVIMLLPKSLHGSANRELLLKDIVRSVPMQTEFKSRLSVLYDLINRIEFVFYESPKGDIICEFPLNDFDPGDFSSNPSTFKLNNKSTDQPIPHYSIENHKLTSNGNIMRGPFSERFIIEKREVYNFSRTFSDEKVRTQMACNWSLIQGHTTTGTQADIGPMQVIELPHLYPLFGHRLEQTDPAGLVSTKEGALLYGHILLNKMNADALTIGLNAIPNFGCWLNRPIYFQKRNCIGSVTSFEHTIVWGMSGSVDSRININYIRVWDGLLDDKGRPAFTTIGGYPSKPFNYAILFKLRDAPSGNKQ